MGDDKSFNSSEITWLTQKRDAIYQYIDSPEYNSLPEDKQKTYDSILDGLMVLINGLVRLRNDQ